MVVWLRQEVKINIKEKRIKKNLSIINIMFSYWSVEQSMPKLIINPTQNQKSHPLRMALNYLNNSISA